MISCGDDGGGAVEIPDFNMPSTLTFENQLSAYGIFDGSPSELIPNTEYHELELSSILFTDYAKKQRLVKVPENEQISRLQDGQLLFPNGTILVKTFYYNIDDRDPSLGKRIIETRLLVKESDFWNSATYIWNDEQTDATLELSGLDVQLSWVNSNGNTQSTLYHVLDENECIACHQSNATVIPLGTTLQNINRNVIRNGIAVNQITHLQTVGVLNSFNLDLAPTIPDYNDTSQSLANRARAYLQMNCAHCHNPDGWEIPADEELDFRFDTPFNQTGIAQESDEIEELIREGEMPFIGTTLLDEEGVELIVSYIQSL